METSIREEADLFRQLSVFSRTEFGNSGRLFLSVFSVVATVLTCSGGPASFALLLLLPVFALALGQLQEAPGDLVVGVAALQAGGGEGVEAFRFGLRPRRQHPRQGGGGARGELQRVQLQRLGAAGEQELVGCRRGRPLEERGGESQTRAAAERLL